MRILAELEKSPSEKERLDLVYRKALSGWWHCRYKYTFVKDGVEVSLSCKWLCKGNEYSVVCYAVKAAALDIERYLNNKELSGHYIQLLEAAWRKYDDRKKLHHKILNRLFYKGNEYVQ